MTTGRINQVTTLFPQPVKKGFNGTKGMNPFSHRWSFRRYNESDKNSLTIWCHFLVNHAYQWVFIKSPCHQNLAYFRSTSPGPLKTGIMVYNEDYQQPASLDDDDAQSRRIFQWMMFWVWLISKSSTAFINITSFHHKGMIT